MRSSTACRGGRVFPEKTERFEVEKKGDDLIFREFFEREMCEILFLFGVSRSR